MKKVISLSIILAMLVSAVPVEAADTIVEQIKTLEAQIKALQEQIVNLPESSNTQTGASGSGSREGGPVVSATFFRNLSQGMSGEDVRALQQYLVTQGFLVMPGGAAYGYFGPATTQAVQKFQSSRGIEATGFVGPQTRAVLNGTSTDTPVPPTTSPVSISFTASPSTVVPGTYSTITWSAPNATSCQLLNTATGAMTQVEPSGSQNTEKLYEKIIYYITCTGGGKSETQQLTVNIGTTPTVALSASPMTINAGESSTITMSYYGDYCLPKNIPVNVFGEYSVNNPRTTTFKVTPTQTTTYELECFVLLSGSNLASGGSAAKAGLAKVTVTVNPVNTTTQSSQGVSISANPISINAGESTTLTWTVNGDRCITRGEIFQNHMWNFGSEKTLKITPTKTTTYEIECFKLVSGDFTNGMETRSGYARTTVFVSQPDAPKVDLKANGANTLTVKPGTSVLLTWESLGATYCSSNINTNTTLNGNRTITVNGYSMYSIFCSNSTGKTGSDQVIINVDAASSNIIAPSESIITEPTTTTQTNPAPTVNISAYPSSVAYNATTKLTWSSSNATSCTLYDSNTGSRMPISLSSSFTTGGLTRNSTYTITCTNSAGSKSAEATVNVSPSTTTTNTTTTTTNTSLPVVNLTASPSSITAGNSSVLQISYSNATYCTGPVTYGSTMVYPTQTTTYTVTCYNSAGQPASKSVTVTVINPTTSLPTVSVSANPSKVSSGQSATVTWSSTNATSCTTWHGARSISGSATVYPTGSNSYVVTCYNSNGQSVSGNATVTVESSTPVAPTVSLPSINLTASPSSITSGSSSILEFSSTNSSYCSGTFVNNGSLRVAPTQTTTYTVTCYNSAGQSASKSVTVAVTAPSVPPPSVSLSASPTSISSGGSSTLTWYSSNAVSCALYDPSIGSQTASLSSSHVVRPTSSTTYSLTCTNSAGQSVTANVTVSVASAATLSVDVKANGQDTLTIMSGQIINFSWRHTGATSCTSNIPAPNPYTTTQWSLGAGVSTTYTIHCYNSAGQRVSDSVYVEVTPEDDTANVLQAIGNLLNQLQKQINNLR